MRATVKHVLAAFDLLDDDTLFPRDRYEGFLRLLYRRKTPIELVQPTLDALKTESAYHSDDSAPRTLDIKQDWNMIVAAFYQMYGIDLEHGDCDWFLFVKLLGGVTDATRLGQIMDIRARKVPKWTAHNGEQVRDIQRLKAIYALKPRDGDYEKGLAGLAKALEAMAKN